jgi:hypothetical protein
MTDYKLDNRQSKPTLIASDMIRTRHDWEGKHDYCSSSKLLTLTADSLVTRRARPRIRY